MQSYNGNFSPFHRQHIVSKLVNSGVIVSLSSAFAKNNTEVQQSENSNCEVGRRGSVVTVKEWETISSVNNQS